jgi:hypothetical protein
MSRNTAQTHSHMNLLIMIIQMLRKDLSFPIRIDLYFAFFLPLVLKILFDKEQWNLFVRCDLINLRRNILF